MGSRLLQPVSPLPDRITLRPEPSLRGTSYATLFSFTVPLMLKVWVVKTAFLFVGLGVPLVQLSSLIHTID